MRPKMTQTHRAPSRELMPGERSAQGGIYLCHDQWGFFLLIFNFCNFLKNYSELDQKYHVFVGRAKNEIWLEEYLRGADGINLFVLWYKPRWCQKPFGDREMLHMGVRKHTISQQQSSFWRFQIIRASKQNLCFGIFILWYSNIQLCSSNYYYSFDVISDKCYEGL